MITPHPTLTAQLAAGLAKVGLVLRHHAWERSGGRGLNPTQSQILAALREGPSGVGEIADRLGVTRATVSDSVAALERKGLVRKRESSKDARRVVLTLTPRGRRESKLIAVGPETLHDAAASLTPEEQGVFIRALVKLIRALQDQGEISVSRMCSSCRYFTPFAHDDPEKPHHCGYVGAPFGDRELRLDCDEHDPAPHATSEKIWEVFVHGRPIRSGALPASEAVDPSTGVER
jgi:DNA-binding MarR family transcriptional regulator